MNHLRSFLLQIIRSLGLSHRLDDARFYWNKVRWHTQNQRFKQEHPDFALPPDYLMYESYQINYSRYRETGHTAALWLLEHVTPLVDATTELSILDWGCGPGRILRHLPEVFGAGCKIHGVDPNAKSVAWCQENLNGVDVQLSQLQPPLPYEANTFDFLYGISIFTHLSGPAHASWMAELMRVLKPGGIALITTHGPAYKVKLTPGEMKKFEAGEDWVIRGQVSEGHRVFTAYHPPELFQALVAPYGEVANYVPGQPRNWGIEQDVWVIKKRV